MFSETGTDALRVLEELVGAVCYAGSLNVARKTGMGRGSAGGEVGEREKGRTYLLAGKDLGREVCHARVEAPLDQTRVELHEVLHLVATRTHRRFAREAGVSVRSGASKQLRSRRASSTSRRAPWTEQREEPHLLLLDDLGPDPSEKNMGSPRVEEGEAEGRTVVGMVGKKAGGSATARRQRGRPTQQA